MSYTRQRQPAKVSPAYKAGRYGAVRAPVDHGGALGSYDVIYHAMDLLSYGMEPRPLYGERRRMERMSPTRLGAYLLLRALYYRLPDRIARTRIVRFMWRLR